MVGKSPFVIYLHGFAPCRAKKSARFVAKKICRDAMSRQKSVSAIKPCAFASKATKRLPTKTYSDLQTWLPKRPFNLPVAPLPSLT